MFIFVLNRALDLKTGHLVLLSIKMIPVLYDETSQISDVFVHEPGLECRIALEAEDPSMWLFDSGLRSVNSTEWIMHAKKEHSGYVQLLQEQGIKVHYLTELLKKHETLLKEMVEQALKSAVAKKLIAQETAEDYWKEVQLDPVVTTLKGMKIKFEDYWKLMEANLSILIPKPNAYFAQDPFAIIGDHFVKLNPAAWQRTGEPELWEIALQPNPKQTYHMFYMAEGGDITIVNKKVFVGIGTRTEPYAAKEIYRLHKYRKIAFIDDVVTVFKPDTKRDLGLNHSVELPYIHQDTIWMPLYNGKFVGNLKLIEACVVWYSANGGQLKTLKDYVTCSQKKIVPVSEKEQYSLAPNVLPANGVVISADVNVETNAALTKHGFDVKTFAAKTLLGGAGSGHCMSNAANYCLGIN